MKRKILQTLRTLLGLLFVFSGFVKCVDPTGGAIKIEDYFIAWGFDFIPFEVDMTLSVLQNVLEFVVGFMLLTNVYTRWASLGALIFMCFFTPLTLYIAIVNPVSDCGCFGDALKLTNWQTFWKNVLFLPVSVFVFRFWGWDASRLSRWRQAAVTCVGLFVAVIISVKGITDEPVIDFRPYSVGTDINQAMAIPEDAPMPEYKSTFILEKDGVRKEFNELDYPYEDSTWVYIDTHTEVISEGYIPPIKDFTLTNADGEIMTNHILGSEQPVILVISPVLDDIDDTHIATLANIYDAQLARGREMYILTSSPRVIQDKIDNIAERGFDFLQADETMLKTITRSNPGFIVVQNGVIIAKYHINHLPNHAFANPLATNLTNIRAENVRLTNLCIIFAVVLILMIIIVRKSKQRTER